MGQDEYLPCSSYENKALHSTESSFAAFQDESNSEYYFALLDAAGKVLLRSESYPQQVARENGIQSVIKNRTNKDFYSVKSEEGKFYLCLRAANYREIARSCPFDTEADALALIPFATGEQIRGAEKERANNKVDDDYLACSAYENHPDVGIDGYKGLVKFKHEDQNYFAWYDDDNNLLMRSEGYPTTEARDKGLASVDKNRELEERYAVIEKFGRFFTILKAGNHQEIARSCSFDSAEAAQSLFPSARAKAAAEKAAAIAAAAAAAEAAAIAARKAREDNYLACSAYENHGGADANGFVKFENEGEYYFAWVTEKGKVRMRSEGYTTAAARDKGIDSVIANRDNKDRYSVVEKSGKQFVMLKAGNHQEIARSCALDDMAAVWAILPILDPNPPTPKSQAREDNYLFCKEYENQGQPDANDVVKWQHTEGEHYFTWLTDSGKVKMRSEGYTTSAARDKGVESLLVNRDNKDRYSIVEKSGKQFVMLKAGNHQEIARSCALDDLGAVWALFPFLGPVPAVSAIADTNVAAPLAAAAAIGAAALVGSSEQEDLAPPPPPVYAAAAASEPEVEAAAAGSGCLKYWWLLGLLLLGLLLYFLMSKGCGSEAASTGAATTATTPPAAPAATTPAPAAAPAPAATTAAAALAKPCNLNWIFFDFNKSDLRAQSETALDDLVKVLNENKEYTALLISNTDSRGSDAYNEALSSRRADAAKAYLVKKGIAESRITARMNGEKDPVAKNAVQNHDSEQGRQFNRRVELYVEDKNGKRVCESTPDIPAELRVKN